jgi:NAD(P)-dependent dehydrogenase (short-subunit alcohol dehydrogenase family)
MGILDKKVVLITGTGGGLGRVAAQTFVLVCGAVECVAARRRSSPCTVGFVLAGSGRWGWSPPNKPLKLTAAKFLACSTSPVYYPGLLALRAAAA